MTPTRSRILVAAAALASLGAFAVAPASAAGMKGHDHMAMKEHTKMVGGAPMYPSKNIIQNAVNSKAHTTLVAAVKAAGLVKTLEGPGPFTVFAPTNSAFSKLPKGTVPTLLKPENKGKLTQVLTYHVVPGRLTESKLHAMITKGHGKAELKTVEGGDLTATRSHGHYYITDAKGDRARITIGDVLQSNGVIHVINKVMLPG